MQDYKAVVHARDVVCQCCGCKGSKDNPLTVHHIKPKCQGGPNTPENCVLLCKNCHREHHEEEGYPHGNHNRKCRKHRHHRYHR